ncbi:MAG TPA: response regulator [Kofleriaceae bacterium]|nr:response regulator [Kofleriaceae bacterium]
MNDKINILLVDDEPRNLDALEAILSDQDYHLIRAEDADRALRLLLDNDDVAAIILDIQMPRVNGIELAQIIKGTKRFKQIPILFLTAHMVDDQDIVVGYGAGAVDYLTKPFNPQILKAKIAVFADLFRKTRMLAELNDTLEARVSERTAELEKSEALLRAAARQKDEFLAVLAHELRNPLAPLRTGLDLLIQMQAPTTPVVGRTLAAMNRQLDHIVRLIDDLLDVSRISRGVLELKKQRVDVATLIHQTSETFRSLLEQRKISVSLDLPRAISVVVDPTRISQIIGNLLHNASKFTPENGHVTVELKYDAGNALITVSDTGVGIPSDQLDRVFEMFAAIERKAQTSRGAGIGLALAKRLAQMHGGNLIASSDGEGKGTTFTLSIPNAELARARTENTPAKGITSGPMGAAALGDPLQILVIEDNDDVADTLAEWLGHMGHIVKVARTGPSGLELVLSTKPDVVLCDVGLPEMDGVEVCKQIRAQTGDFRPLVVALTGWGKEEDRKRTTDAGFDHHLVKPVALDMLSDVLKRVGPRRTN